MLNRTIRHWMVAVGLVAIAGVTAASASGLVRASHQASSAAIERIDPPTVGGDLGEVVVYAPGNFGAGVIHAPHDLGEVLVLVPREPTAKTFLAQIVVTAPRDSAAQFETGAAVTVAAVR
ncbi:MAG TPA: hypothetical protein VN787_05665 [Steroidobacteraceae bacterium]|nr:hypothetical protein [Steroidobacteraceae bacterium]